MSIREAVVSQPTPIQTLNKISGARLLPISTRTVIARGTPTERTLHTYCPMYERSVTIETCADCRMCVGFDGDRSEKRPHVLCSFDAPQLPARARPVGCALSRYSVCVRGEWTPEVIDFAPFPGNLVPILDEASHVLGVVYASPSPAEGALGLCLVENESVGGALTRMALRRARQAPVVTREGTFVGTAEDLEMMRILASDPEDGRGPL
jgi:hypothetical protein